MSAHRQRGFALLIVLWAMVLLALIGAQLTGSARRQAMIAENQRAAAIAQAVADGAVQVAIYHLLDPSAQGWTVSAAPYAVALPGGTARVGLRNEADRISLNAASPDLLRGLLVALGVEERQALALAATISAWPTPQGAALAQAAGLPWQPRAGGYSDPWQIAAVPGVTPDLVRALVPHLTCLTDDGPRPATRDPVVATAMAISGDTHPPPPPDAPGGARVIDVIATGRGAQGGVFTRQAAVLVDPGNAPHPFQILGWGVGEDTD